MNNPDHARATVSRRQVLRAGAAAGAAALITSSLPARAIAEGSKRGGTMRHVLDPEPKLLCSLTSTSTETSPSSKIFDGLFSYDMDRNVIPRLALSWEASEDGRRLTFNLRPGVRWHDGAHFTSADVAKSFELLKRWHPRGRVSFQSLEMVETPDDLTAIFVLTNPAPHILNALDSAESPIIPAHIYGDLAEDKNPAEHPAAIDPVGTGPFRFVEWARTSYIKLERNPDYWDPELPYLDELRFVMIPDVAARAIAFEAQEIDYGHSSPAGFSEVDRLKELPYLDINSAGTAMNPAQLQIDFNLAHPILGNLEVRRAIAHAIDRQKIVDIAFFGFAVVSPSPISVQNEEMYNPDVETYPFDPAKAEAMLDAAGYPRGSNGVRFSLTHDYIPYNADAMIRQASYVRQALKDVGIDVTVRSNEWAAWLKRIYTDRDFDFTANYTTNSYDPTAGVQRLYWSKNIKTGVPFTNATYYKNEEVDRLLEAAAVEMDREKRAQLFKEFQIIACRDLPSMPTVTIVNYNMFNTRLQGHSNTFVGRLDNFAETYFGET